MHDLTETTYTVSIACGLFIPSLHYHICFCLCLCFVLAYTLISLDTWAHKDHHTAFLSFCIYFHTAFRDPST